MISPRYVSLLLLGLILWQPTARTAEAAKLTDVTKSGVVGDGTTLNTEAIQKAIDECSAQGGGTVQFPAGRYLTGTIQLKDNVTLRLEEQAVILGSTNAADYRNVDPFIDGVGAQMGYALVAAIDAKNVGIEGAGVIDGQGKAVKAAQSRYTIRPFLVRWVRCADVAVKDVRLSNSGAWTMNFFQTRNVAVERVTIRSRGLSNNDGIDVDSCENVRIRDCDIDSGDDAICLKATSPQPCRDIAASGCKLKTDCNAIKLGTESIGDFEKIRVSNCQIRDTHLAGIALYSVDGAHLHDVEIADIAMDRVNVPISVRLGARLKTFRAGDEKKPVGTLSHATIRNVKATGTGQVGMLINGVPGHLVEDLSFENIDLELAGGGTAEDAQIKLAEKEGGYPEIKLFGPKIPVYGIYARHAKGLKFTNVQMRTVQPDARPAKYFEDVADVQPADFVPAPQPAAQ